jgi:anti-sigma B factor antagonist
LKSFEVVVIEKNEEKSYFLIEINGYLDSHTIDKFEKTIEELIEDNLNYLILDTKNLKYISSAGIGALMSFEQQLGKKGEGRIILLNPSEKVASILSLLGFTKIFRIFDSKESALESITPVS